MAEHGEPLFATAGDGGREAAYTTGVLPAQALHVLIDQSREIQAFVMGFHAWRIPLEGC